MMQKLVRFMTYSKAASYVAASLCVVSWCLLTTERLVSLVGHLLLILMAGYLLVRTNRVFSLSDTKSTLPATLFYLGCALAPDLLSSRGTALHLVLLAIAFHLLLRTHRSRHAMGRYFVAFTLIGLQCMLTPPLLLLMPWLVVCALPMESLHGRTLLASLWGLLFPFWIACGVLFLAGHTAPIVAYLGSVVPAAYPVLPPLAATSQWFLLLWALLLIVPGSVTVLVSRTMKLQASAGFRLMLSALVVLLAAMGLGSESFSALLPTVMLIASLMGSALFASAASRAKSIYLVVLTAIGLLLIILSLCSTF